MEIMEMLAFVSSKAVHSWNAFSSAWQMYDAHLSPRLGGKLRPGFGYIRTPNSSFPSVFTRLAPA